MKRSRVAQLMRSVQIEWVLEYKVVKPTQLVTNQLGNAFQQDQPDHAGITDTNDIRIHVGWLYWIDVLVLHFRALVCWCIGSPLQMSLVLVTLTMPVLGRRATRIKVANLLMTKQNAGSKTIGQAPASAAG